MLKSKYLQRCLWFECLFMIISIINYRFEFINIPSNTEMIGYQFSLLTVSTVFAGFSFTALGMLLGFSSEELIIKLKDTDFMLNNVNKLIMSVVLFSVSIIFSLIYILGFDDLLGKMIYRINDDLFNILRNLLFLNCIGFLVCGFIEFLLELKQFYNLLSHIYKFKKIDEEKKSKFFAALDKAKKKQTDNTLFEDE